VVGNKPPDGYGMGKGMGKKVKCSSREECQDIGAVAEREEFGNAPSKDIQYQKTPSGARYKDMEEGKAADGVAQIDSTVQIRYRVMRSGKRSADGLSGEASTIFSLGYGEDEGPKDAVLTETLGQGKFVKALDEGIVGMAVGGKRRVQVRPEYGLGWRKPGKCAEADFAVGASVGLPGGGAEKQEACIQQDKLPQPVDFASKRRFSRRFDESLIVEVELMGLGQK